MGAIPKNKSAMIAALKRLVSGALDLSLPPHCVITGEPVAKAGQLSPRAWDGISFLGRPHCAICGFPFEFDLGEDALCGTCARQAPPYDWARAVMRYDGVARDLILGFKHGDRTHGAPLFGRWLARLCLEHMDLEPGAAPTMVAPVPLHARRLAKRRYNQAALLAHAMVKDIRRQKMGDGGLAIVPDLLTRTRNTAEQGGNIAQRARNMSGAFAVPQRHLRRVEANRIVLVDDVHTTGATLAECARVLQRAGARSVHALTLARVVRSG